MENRSVHPTASQTEYRPLIILLLVPVLLTCLRYYGWDDYYVHMTGDSESVCPQYYFFISSFLLLGIIPALIWRFGFRQSLEEMGLGPGDLSYGLKIAAAGVPLMIFLSYFSAGNAEFTAEYPLFRGLVDDRAGIIPYFVLYGLYYIGWEAFFRGFMLFGLRSRFGDAAAILIQTIPSCLMHIGKPKAEIFASIVAGIAFGAIVLRCRSIWPIFLCHWCLGVSLDIFIIRGGPQ